MHQVCREINFCYGHRLLDYDGKCRHLHGHNGRLLITVQASELDNLGMVLDFSQISFCCGSLRADIRAVGLV
jgi:6-pyruvoyltetrahydropterin/6-carboxytetrahydropterin synthase